ncbi:MAG: nuclear transport factor 2 family protein [Oscillospiraceae bacterium]
MEKRELIIENYFKMWVKNDSTGIEKIFADNVTYNECYGPEYNGLKEVLRWFDSWNAHGKVLKWEIKQFVHQGDVTVAEWFFNSNYKGRVDAFDGVTIFTFNEFGQINDVKEFESAANHTSPYKKK